jgi:isocitrate dehydrogenase
MSYQHIKVPEEGRKITLKADGTLDVPDQPIIPYIEGDGVGVDITPVAMKVVDAAVEKTYDGKRRIHWMEVYAGEKAAERYGAGQWMPQETLDALREHVVSIKGPLAIRPEPAVGSLNVLLRHKLDLYACLRPVRHLKGVPAPLRAADKIDVVVFRENSEDIYSGVEYHADSPQARELIGFLQKQLGATGIRFPATSSIGIKPVSREGTERLVRKAVQYAIDHQRTSVTLVHKGNVMSATEGAFRDWGYAMVRREFDAEVIDSGPWLRITVPENGREIIVRDLAADAFFEQFPVQPTQFDVIATMNLNGDYISASAAALAGASGIAPGANMSDSIAVFESTHGEARKYATKDYVNPGSVILAAVMMLRHMGWIEAADAIVAGLEAAIQSKHVTYDFARLLEGAVQVSSSGFGQEVIDKLPAPRDKSRSN